MTTAEKILIALRERPLTRPELSIHIVELSGRALLYQLEKLRINGFVAKEGSKRSPRFRLLKEEGLLQPCHCCRIRRPCWQVNGDLCQYCINARGIGAVKPKPAKQPPQALGRKLSMFAKDDACSKRYQPLLRSQKIGY
ncbi:hypothetical protein ABT56_00460 [Photobacterium aquae]|uniref:Uncharacterized protein n=1 Tax=Photobacterium aquae TaxID=1195763 RepID=A0A0J1HD89_9GAMM|nr:hypothetical protein [Photobacterium aquae]KLV09593.1 hypothetical protein ABT56_00460 [Photobacterium aquae]